MAPETGILFYKVVERINQPPILDPIGSQSAPPAQTLSLAVSASDPDGDPVVLGVGPLPLPTGAAFDAVAGVFTFRPSAEQVGDHTLTFSASDGLETDSEAVTITVPAPLPGAVTGLQGRVLDANAFAGGSTVPVIGATVSLLATGHVTVTDAQGIFTLADVPSGSQVPLRGRTSPVKVITAPPWTDTFLSCIHGYA